jgi:pyruvate/2-oxoglutarate/acetoin dehydrogenase E1 component
MSSAKELKGFEWTQKSELKYYPELCKAMNFLAKDSRVLFVGQAVAVKGTAMTTTLKDVPKEKLIELPVAEEMQMGMSVGMALQGFVPVTIYPRWNFLLLAVNQVVNHLDKIKHMSRGGFAPKVIIRTGIGSQRPLNPQCQHLGDFTEAFRSMCTNIEVIRLDEPNHILPAYMRALRREDGVSTILVEHGDFYNEK